MKYWVVSAGSAGREYSRTFLDYGMAFVGGDVPLARWAEVEENDVMILKQGLSKILAAGHVVSRDGRSGGNGDKEWLKDFDGWNLPGYRYVDWKVPEKPIEAKSMGLAIGTIYETPRPDLQSCATDIIANGQPWPVVRRDPPEQPRVSDEQLLSALVKWGLRPSAADELTNTLRRIRLLANYYYDECRWDDIREHETRTFLVVPLLLALGWSEQQLKIEYPVAGGRIDIACFASPYDYRKKPAPVLLIETKGFSSGLDYAPEQGQGYAKQYPGCSSVLVTNGYCYKLFRRKDGEFDKTPDAYLNLLQPRACYPLDPAVPGALEVLHELIPRSAT